MAKFREFLSSTGKVILGGRNDENNEELVNQAKSDEYILHTALPGSPFVNIKSAKTEVTKEDLKEAALFCAVYSQAWKKARIKKDVVVHVFEGKNVHKDLKMKIGTFGVKSFKELNIKKHEIQKFEDLIKRTWLKG